MKKIILFLIWCVCTCTVFSQTDDAAKYAAGITGDNLKKHLTIIAGDSMEGRETGTEGQRKAAAYIESQFKLIGLLPPKDLGGYQQDYQLYKDSVNVTSSSVSINDVNLKYSEDYFVTATNNYSKKITADEFVFAGYGISEEKYDDYNNLNVAGKVVVIFLGEPKVDGKYVLTGSSKFSKYTFPGIPAKLQAAAKKGAVAVIIINQEIPGINNGTANFNSKTKLYYPAAGKESNANYFVASHKVLKTFFKAWHPDSLINSAMESAVFKTTGYGAIKAAFRFEYQKERKIINASNVLGVIEGTDKKDEYVFLTAHYDHLGKRDGKIYYGADDDGSGTCAVINMAEAFAKAKAEGKGPRRTIVFMTVSGEEKGLWGSAYYTDHPVFPLDKTTVDLNTDMIGRIDTERSEDDSLNYVYVIGHDKLSSDLPVIESINKKYTGLVMDYKFDDPEDKERIYSRSDHYNFAKKGVPVLFFYDGMLKGDYHRPTDTIDKINWPLYEKRARLIFYTAWEMANRDSMLVRDIPLPAEE